jgi:hypothetical protein
MRLNDIRNALPRKGLFTEAALYVIENLCMIRVGIVKNILEPNVSRTKTIAKVLGKDPSAVYVYALKVKDI